MPELPSNEVKVPSKSAEDIVDIFKQDDKKEDKIPPVKDDKKDGDKKDEDDEIVIKEDKDEDDEKIDLTVKDDDDEIEIDAPPRKQQILKDFPELFKKYPFLEKVLYRDKEYRELFGSFDDAKEIAEKAEVFSNFESQLLSGKTDEILKNVKDTDSKAFNKIVDDYLPALARVDKDAYFEVIGNIGKQLIMEMVKEAKSSSNEDLQAAALAVNQFLFGSSEFKPPVARVTDTKTTEQQELEQERLSHIQERFETSRDELQGRVDNLLKNTISEYIDPKGMMSAYVKKNAIADALNDLNKSIGDDSSTRKNLDRLWRSAFDSKFSKESLSKIQSFYLGRAKMGLPAAIKKARAEALKDASPKKEVDEEKEEETPRKRGLVNAGRPSQQKSSQKMEKGESVADFFARE